MTPTLLYAAFILSGFGIWWTTRRLESSRRADRVRDMESRLRFAQNETFELRQQVGNLKSEVTVLQSTLGEERVSKQSELAALGASLQKGIFAAGLAALAVGIVMGGFAGWMASAWRTEARMSAEKFESELRFRVAAFKNEVLEKQVSQLENQIRERQSARRERNPFLLWAEANFPESLSPELSPAYQGLEPETLAEEDFTALSRAVALRA